MPGVATSRVLLRAAVAVAIVLCSATVSIGQPTYCAPPKPPGAPPAPDRPKPVCDPWDCSKCCKSPTAIASGAYVRDDRDLSVKTAAGFPLDVSRHYDSSRATDGPLGMGWSSNLTLRVFYAAYLLSAPATYSYEADVQMPTGNVYRFTLNGSNWTPPTGRREKLVRNGDGSFTLTLEGGRSIYQFGADGNITSMTDEFGNSLQYTYASGRLQRVSDASGSGRYLDVTWLNGRISYITDSSGRQVKYSYAADGTLSSVADPVAASANEQSTYYSYEPGRFAPVLSLIRDRWLRQVSDLTWDPQFRLKSYTDGEYNDANPALSAGEKFVYDYHPDAGTPQNPAPFTSKSDTLGTQNYSYDSLGLVKDRTQYDSQGRITSQERSGVTTLYTYDTQGRLATRTTSGLTWTYGYDVTFPEKVNSITSNVPSKNAGWQYEYFPLGSPAPGALKLVKRVRTDGSTVDVVTSYTYDARGRPLTVTSAPDFLVEYFYAASGNLSEVRQGGFSTTYGYDGLGRVTSVTDAAGHATTYTYDADDRVLTVTLPKPSATSTLDFTSTHSYDNYDATSGLVFVRTTDPNGRITQSGYDALGHLVKAIDSRGYATVYGYQYSLLKSITDANGNKTTYSYDANRQLSATTFPDGAVEQYVRSIDGRLESMTDRKGVQVLVPQQNLWIESGKGRSPSV